VSEVEPVIPKQTNPSVTWIARLWGDQVRLSLLQSTIKVKSGRLQATLNLRGNGISEVIQTMPQTALAAEGIHDKRIQKRRDRRFENGGLRRIMNKVSREGNRALERAAHNGPNMKKKIWGMKKQKKALAERGLDGAGRKKY